MTDDTKRALEIIKPMADELNIKVDADDRLLYCNGQAIGIGCNSTYATVMEFIGYLMVKEYHKFRQVMMDGGQRHMIQRYWFTKDQLSKIKGDEE